MVPEKRLWFLLEKIHQANPHYEKMRAVDFDRKEVLCSEKLTGPLQRFPFEISRDTLTYRGVKLAI